MHQYTHQTVALLLWSDIPIITCYMAAAAVDL